jgi:hypothetical protein
MRVELVRPLNGDFSLPFMALCLIIVVGVFSWETWVGVGEWKDAGVKSFRFKTFLNTY